MLNKFMHQLRKAAAAIVAEWSEQKDGAGAYGPADVTRNLSPENVKNLPAGSDHYRAYVGPPDRFDFMSATQFSLLFANGLRERHCVLDFWVRIAAPRPIVDTLSL